MSRMAASVWRALSVLILFTAGCAAPAPQVKRIVLLAPFESTYREVGYDALYPVRLALADEAVPDVQLLSVDDGGNIDKAVLHAQALAADPNVTLALVAGPIATDNAVLDALQDIPVVVIGEWAVTPEQGVFILASEAIAMKITSRSFNIYEAAALNEATGGEIFGLKSFAALSPEPGNITVVTSAGPPSAEFRERLLTSDLFVPEPGQLATLAYDAGMLAARVVSQSATRTDVQAALRESNFEGINGKIRFNAHGYWADAPVHEYQYRSGVLKVATD
jgi:hypothetical protein